MNEPLHIRRARKPKYSSKQDALMGHLAMLDMVRKDS